MGPVAKLTQPIAKDFIFSVTSNMSYNVIIGGDITSYGHATYAEKEKKIRPLYTFPSISQLVDHY